SRELEPGPGRSRLRVHTRWEDIRRTQYVDYLLMICRGDLGPSTRYPNLTVNELLARGLPVISTTAGAIPDLLEDGVSGLLVKAGDWRETGAAIHRIFTEPDLRKSLAEGAFRAAAMFPSWDDMTNLVFEAVENRIRQIENV
ncbi:MAG: glycosyltransferase, partial [Candidatus Fermentibacteria bacterium]